MFPCLVKTFDKFDAGLREWKKRCLNMKSRPFGMQNIHAIMWSNGEQWRCQLFIKHVFLYIKKTVQLIQSNTSLYQLRHWDVKSIQLCVLPIWDRMDIPSVITTLRGIMKEKSYSKHVYCTYKLNLLTDSSAH